MFVNDMCKNKSLSESKKNQNDIALCVNYSYLAFGDFKGFITKISFFFDSASRVSLLPTSRFIFVNHNLSITKIF